MTWTMDCDEQVVMCLWGGGILFSIRLAVTAVKDYEKSLSVSKSNQLLVCKNLSQSCKNKREGYFYMLDRNTHLLVKP